MYIRLQHNYTREYLAERADISAKYLYEVEMGKKGCSAYIFYRLASALEVNSDYIMNGETFLEADHGFEHILCEFTDKQIEVVKEIIRQMCLLAH